MAPRKNTQGAEDSLKGAQPEQAEAQIAPGETGQQPTGGSDEGDTGAAAGPAPDAAQAVLMAAVSSIKPDDALVLPEGMKILIPLRSAIAADTIIHNGVQFVPGDPIPVSAAEFAALSKCGAVVEDDWDELQP